MVQSSASRHPSIMKTRRLTIQPVKPGYLPLKFPLVLVDSQVVALEPLLVLGELAAVFQESMVVELGVVRPSYYRSLKIRVVLLLFVVILPSRALDQFEVVNAPRFTLFIIILSV